MEAGQVVKLEMEGVEEMVAKTVELRQQRWWWR